MTYAKDYPESFSDPACKDPFRTWGNGTWDIFKPCANVSNGQCISAVNPWTEGISLIQAFTTPLNPYWASEGAFGLGFTYSTDNPVLQALKQFQQQQVTLALKRREVLPPSALAGYLTFGGRDSVNCDGKWKVGARGLGDWKITVTSLHVGLLSPVKVFSGSATGWFQTATAFIVAPAPTVDQIVRLLKAEYDHASDRYVIDCTKARSAPTLRFGLGTSMAYDLPAKDYVRKFQRSDGRCVLMFLPIDNVNLSHTWLLGTTFNRPYCAMFDNKKDVLHFSKAL
ncbi:CRE-ASP-1 protein [Aphelenchoides avenae]|nr:CRE-ASP-1 protein [Aphelenchus avenae]